MKKIRAMLQESVGSAAVEEQEQPVQFADAPSPVRAVLNRPWPHPLLWSSHPPRPASAAILWPPPPTLETPYRRRSWPRWRTRKATTRAPRATKHLLGWMLSCATTSISTAACIWMTRASTLWIHLFYKRKFGNLRSLPLYSSDHHIYRFRKFPFEQLYQAISFGEN